MTDGGTTHRRRRDMVTPQAQLNEFIAKYSPTVARNGRAVVAKLRRLLPGAVRMVYDNYNFLVVGFGPSERPSDAILSVAFAPRWVVLCFLQNGPKLPDPNGLLRGSGNVVRNIRLISARAFDAPPVRALVKAALAMARVPIPRTGSGRLVIKSISARQRPRRPVE